MVGAELQRARLEAGLTQEDLAARAQIDRTYVSLLENDRKSPTLAMLFRVCGVLNIKVSTLIARVERQNASNLNPPVAKPRS